MVAEIKAKQFWVFSEKFISFLISKNTQNCFAYNSATKYRRFVFKSKSCEVWRDRKGGKGFGWVKTKSQKFICKRKNFGYVDNKNFTSDRDKPGIKGKTLTGINKHISDVVSEENSRTDYQEDKKIQR